MQFKTEGLSTCWLGCLSLSFDTEHCDGPCLVEHGPYAGTGRNYVFVPIHELSICYSLPNNPSHGDSVAGVTIITEMSFYADQLHRRNVCIIYGGLVACWSRRGRLLNGEKRISVDHIMSLWFLTLPSDRHHFPVALRI